MSNWLHSRHRWKGPFTEAYTKSYNPVKEAVAVPRRKKEDMTKQASEADAEQWSSWSSWTWSPSSRSSWWDSSSSQTPRKSEWPTTSDVSATRLEHIWKNTSSWRRVAKRLRQFFIFFNLRLDNRRVTIRKGDARGYKLSRCCIQMHMWRTQHTEATLMALGRFEKLFHQVTILLTFLGCVRRTTTSHYNDLTFSTPCWFFDGTLG